MVVGWAPWWTGQTERTSLLTVGAALLSGHSHVVKYQKCGRYATDQTTPGEHLQAMVVFQVLGPAREPASRSNGEWRNPGQMAAQLDSLRPPGEA